MFTPPLLDIVGKKYFRLQAIKHIKGGKWLFRCDCGKLTNQKPWQVRQGNVKSCGCFHREQMSKTEFGNRIKHGDKIKGKIAKLYRVWESMKDRCAYPSNHAYKRYGARGIYVCDKWKLSYVDFKVWALKNGYKEGLTIERLNNDGPYNPNNCAWVSRKVQARNRITTRWIDFDGKRKSLSEWAEIKRIASGTLRARIFKSGWSIKMALETPTRS